MKKVFIAICMLVLVAPAYAQHEGARYRKIDSLLNYYFENNKFMGAVAILEKGNIVFENAYGYADADARIPANAGTKYKVGSITGMFTSAIIYQLVEEKKVKTDTKLSEFFPKVKNAEKITIADMLSHKSGIYDYTIDPSFASYRSKLQNRRDMTQRIEAFTPAFEPGERAEFSNTNYLLLGYIIQDITKKTYKDNVTQRVIQKAGLKNTYYYNKIITKKNEAYSYLFENGQWVKQEEWHETVAGAAGGLQSTATDIAKFMKALFSGKLIKKELLNEMAQIEMGFGKGIFAIPFAERKFLGHSGIIEGFASVAGYYPKDDVSIALLINGNNYNYNDILTGILSCYYKLPYLFPNFTTAKVDEAVLKSYEGTYTTPSLPFKVKITYKNGQLIAHATNQGSFPLNPLSATEFNFDPAGITMTFSAKGFVLQQADGSKTVFTKE